MQPNGSKLWRLAYRFSGKQKLLALGVYPLVSLAQARAARAQATLLIAGGVDPSEERKAAKRALSAPETTFTAVADEYLLKLEREGRAEATLKKTRWLLSFAEDGLGPVEVNDRD